MRLVNYGCGEIIDRLSILALKRLYGAAASKPIDHFQREALVLQPQLSARATHGGYFAPSLDLAAVNGALWTAEDQLRALSKLCQDQPRSTMTREFWESAALLAFRIQELNDQRASLIEAINKLTGEHQGREKAHAD